MVNFKKMTYSLVIIRSGIIILFVLLSVSLGRNIAKVIGASKKIAEVESQIAALKQEKTKLEGEKEKLGSEEFFEKEARDKLGLAKEGEVVIVLPEDDVLRQIAPFSEDELPAAPDPNHLKWLKLFL